MTLTANEMRMKAQRQSTAIDLYLLQDAKAKKDDKLYQQRFQEVLAKAQAGDEGARRNLVAMRQKRAMFEPEDLLQLVISHAKNLDPTSENQQDFIGPIMAITNIFINQENGDIQKAGNSTLQNIETIIATNSLGEEKLFNTNEFYYDGKTTPQIIINSDYTTDGVYAEIKQFNPSDRKEHLVASADLGQIYPGKINVSDKIFTDYVKGDLNNGKYSLHFLNQNGDPIDLKPRIGQKLESYNFKEGTVETEGGIVRNISDIAK